MARTESSARLGESASAALTSIAAVDRFRVKDSFRRFSASPQLAMEYLYARLFTQSPELRTLFPLSMERTRARTLLMLTDLIANLDDPDAVDRLLDGLGPDHRKFGVREGHYPAFFGALLATAAQVSGPDWTAEVSEAWQSVLGYFADRMKAAAADDGKAQPAWWIGEIVQHDRRTETVAVLTIRPDRPLRYQPGQYVAVQVPKWPRTWRKY
jgi:hemoglobin-like flavoprotein